MKSSILTILLGILLQSSIYGQGIPVNFSSIPKSGTALVYCHQDDDVIWMLPFWTKTEKFISGAIPSTPLYRNLVHEQQIYMNSEGYNIDYESNWITPWTDITETEYFWYYWNNDPAYAYLALDHIEARLSDAVDDLSRTDINKIKAKLEQYFASPGMLRYITHNDWGEYGNKHHMGLNKAVRELAVKYRKDVWMLGADGDFDEWLIPEGADITYTMANYDATLFAGIRNVYFNISTVDNYWTWNSTYIPTGDIKYIKIVDAGIDKSDILLPGEIVTVSGPVQDRTGSYILNGTDDYLTLAGNNNTSFTIGMWIKPDQIRSMDISKMSEYPSAPTCDRSFFMQSDGHISARINDGSSKTVTSATALSPGNWYHILMTADGSNLKIYINGAFESSVSAGYASTSYISPEFVIGQAQETPSFFVGQISDVTLYDHVLTDPEIAALAGSTPVAPEPPQIGTITQPTCSEPTGSVDLSGLPSTGTWTVTSSPGGLTITGTGPTTTGTFSGLSASTTYTFTVTDEMTGLTSASSSEAVINAQPSTTVPVISGPVNVCSGNSGNVYSTETGMTGYTWAVSTGGTITAGGGTTNNSVTVTWNTSGPQTVSVNYTNSNSCTATTPTIYNVTVNALPVPVIAGPTAVCAGTAGNVYSTTAGMTNYTWAVSTGGTITAGGGTTNNSVTVTWNASGPQTVSVNYTNSNSCTATTPSVYNVTINPLPDVNLSVGGAGSICSGTGTNITVASSETGTSYQLRNGITSVGTPVTGTGNAINLPTGNLTATTTFNVYATNSCGSVQLTATATVTVNALPVPEIAGPTAVCAGTAGNVYSTTAGMTNYTWAVSTGGTITAGGGTTNNSVTVTWNTSGPQTVSVNYTNSSNCTATTPAVYIVTVNALPVPEIAGPTAVCAGTAGNVYSTTAGMTNYTWAVSTGGTITAGGGTTNNSVTVTWNTSGPQTVSVNYTNSNSCTATTPSVYNVTIDPLPDVNLSVGGAGSICSGTGTNITVASSETGTSYQLRNGIIAVGTPVTGTGNAINLPTGNLTATTTFNVYATNSCGSVQLTATATVTVNALPVPEIAGPTAVCAGTAGNVYSTTAGMTGYTWAVSTGGTITAGGGTTNNSVTVTWNASGPQTVSVNYTNSNSCTATTPSVYNVTINPLPDVNLSVGGAGSICSGTGTNITVASSETGTSYQLRNGITSVGTPVTGTGNAINLPTGNLTATTTFNVYATNSCGSVQLTATATVTVNALPVPEIAGPTAVCAGTAGNVYSTTAGMTNYTWAVSTGGTITAGGGTTNNSVTVTWNTSGPQTVSVNYTNSNSCTATTPSVYNVTIDPLPDVNLSVGGAGSICSGTGTNITVASSETGTSYQLRNGIIAVGTPVTGTGNAINLPTGNLTATTTFNVYATNSCGSVQLTATATVTVNALPVPEIAGPTAVCAGTAGNVYSTTAGMTGYTWAVSTGGTITAGGGTTNNSVTVTWNTSGPQTVSVNYTNSSNCTATTPAVYNVTVNALPVPEIAGPTAVCAGTAGNVYSTTAGMTNYTWAVSTGGTITAGGGTTNNSVTVTWNASGPQTVSVNYTNSNSCTATTPSVYNVTINPLPDVNLSVGGAGSICSGTGTNITVASSETGTSYQLRNGITSVGTPVTGTGNAINLPTGNLTATTTFNVYATNSCGSVQLTATATVTVNALPVPEIAGPTAVCAGTAGNVYSTTAGMTNYTWAVSTGGTITAGGGTTNNSVTVTWNTSGPQTVSVNYTNSNSCTATTPSVYNVTIDPLPDVNLSVGGAGSICSGTGTNITVASSETGTSYQLRNGIIAVGTPVTGTGNAINLPTGNLTATTTFNVYATNSCGSVQLTATATVTVNALPVPEIAGPTAVCAGTAGNVYSATAGMTGYTWAVSTGGTITAGGGTTNNSVTVTWNTSGPQTVSVNYTNSSNCTATTPAVYNVTVNALPVPEIAGPTAVCAGTAGNVYSTTAGMTNYTWAVSTGGTITAGGGTTNNSVTVTWNASGPQTVSVNYTNSNSCTATTPAVYNVTVNALPVPTISGPALTSTGTINNVYITEAGKTGYVWTISTGGTITAGAGTNAITVTWNTAGPQTVSVFYANTNGCSAIIPTVYNVTVNLNLSLSFAVGWNWFSVNTLLADMSLGNVLSSVATDGDYIKNQVASATYYSGFGWFGSLTLINPKELYKIKVQNTHIINLSGAPVNTASTSIDLVTGWNWIGYLPQNSLPINSGFSSLSLFDQDYIKSQTQSSTYYAGYGWFGSLTDLSPGEGYMMKLASPGTLKYPDAPLKGNAPASGEMAKITFNPADYEFNGTVTATVVLDGKVAGSDDDLLLAYVKDELRGVTRGYYFDPLGVYLFPIMVYSNISEGDSLKFRYYDAMLDATYECKENICFMKDMVISNAFKSFALSTSSTMIHNEQQNVPEEIKLKTFPSPFARLLTIEYNNSVQSNVKLMIYDIYGKLVKQLVDEEQMAGQYSVQWNSSSNEGGIYIIVLQTGSRQITRKVIRTK